MVDRDEQRVQEIRDQLARMREGLADEERQRAEQEDARRAERDREAASPVQPGRRGRRAGPVATAALYLGLALVVFVCFQLARTVGQYTGADLADAKRTGQATVRSCERQGPVGAGFGYWDRCTADVVWSDGTADDVTPKERGFFSADEIGSTVTIGDLGYDKGGQSYARAERPPRPLVTVLSGAFLMISVLVGLLLAGALLLGLRGALRRRSRSEAAGPR